MDGELTFTLMVQCTLDAGNVISSMVEARKHGMMELNMRDNIRKLRNMVKDISSGLMAQLMKEILLKTILKEE